MILHKWLLSISKLYNYQLNNNEENKMGSLGADSLFYEDLGEIKKKIEEKSLDNSNILNNMEFTCLNMKYEATMDIRTSKCFSVVKNKNLTLEELFQYQFQSDISILNLCKFAREFPLEFFSSRVKILKKSVEIVLFLLKINFCN